MTATLERKNLVATLEEKTREADRIAGTFSFDEKGRATVSTEQANGFKKVSAEVKELRALIEDIDAIGEVKEWLEAADGESVAASDTARRYGRGVEGKSLADMFMDSAEYKQARENVKNGKSGFDAFSVDIEGKSIFNLSAGTQTTNALGTVDDRGIAEMARRKMHVRDLFPKSSTNASTLIGIRETGWVNNAKQITQRVAADDVSPATGADSDRFMRAPRSKLTMEPVKWEVGEIAHLLDAHKNILADDGRLRTFINTRMLEGVKYAEDWDLLWGAGGVEKVTGILQTPGIQEYTGLATDKYSVQIRRAITKALIAEYDPTGVILSPNKWEEVEIETDDTGAFRVAVSVAIGAQKQVWRLNVVETTAMSDSEFLVGAFGMAAQLHDRQSVSVRVSTENADNMERGVVTFRADERLALEIPRPEAFVHGTWTTPTP